MIPRRPLKAIKAYIETHDPELRVSNQKIADALAKCGVRVPRRRHRKMNKVTAALATI
jgi:DNA-directed RNA polymerase specialized sigma54-like protein